MILPWNPKELDIVFTSGRDPVSCIFNRSSGAGIGHAFDYTVPTHVFFTTFDSGQWFATELTEDGIEEDSLEKYITKRRFKARLHSVYRWPMLGETDTRERVLQYLAELRQRDHGYDWIGAIRCNRVVRRLFPRLRDSKAREYCSENVFSVLKWQGWKAFPHRWLDKAPHPFQLLRAIMLDTTFSLMYENTL